MMKKEQVSNFFSSIIETTSLISKDFFCFYLHLLLLQLSKGLIATIFPEKYGDNMEIVAYILV